MRVRCDNEDWVHDDALKNWEFWISRKRAQLLQGKKRDAIEERTIPEGHLQQHQD
jgi:hypothetical protein